MSDSNLFGNFLDNLLAGLLYPFQAFIELLLYWSNYVLNIFITFINSILGLFDQVTYFISNFMYNIIPSLWLVLVLLGFSIVIILRVYHFIKDISIAGFKI